jgi:NTP pyrophosphatase (non-canonical NTP hydrolase)
MNMARITVAGDAVVVTSAMSLENLKTIAKYRPKALTLMGGENNKEPVFAVGVTKGSGNINQFGASFGGESHDEQKLATITLAATGITGDVKDWIADNIGSAIISLNRLEADLPYVLEEIADEKATVLSNITVA